MSEHLYELKPGLSVIPLPDHILVHNIEHGERKTPNGLIIPDDNGKESGIRPRFCTVWSVGKDIDYVSPGDKILVSHARWTRGIKISLPDGGSTVIRRIDPKDILLVMNNE